MYELGFFPCLEVASIAVTYLRLPAPLRERLPDWPLDLVNARLSPDHHGDFTRWAEAISHLPGEQNARWRDGDIVTIEHTNEEDLIHDCLQVLHPWRKGPFKVGDVFIDTEWRSDAKWRRLAPHLSLQGHDVLDIGSGNGYFGWRMLHQGANSVIGIDPTILFCMQHIALQRFIGHPDHWVLPLGIEEIPSSTQFDTVLSMGVIYHRRDAREHVRKLADLTRPGGSAVLESLIVRSERGFEPDGRYARMRNVWWIPSLSELEEWMTQAGFSNVEILDVTTTTTAEQRTTPWMRFESLQETLNPENSNETVEGYPAPVRGMLIGTKDRQ